MNLMVELKHLKHKMWARKQTDRHVHCLICSKAWHLTEDDYAPRIYICGDCVKTFTTEYLLYRIQCANNYIHRPEFDVLEERLTFGAKCEPDPEDNGRICIGDEDR